MNQESKQLRDNEALFLLSFENWGTTTLAVLGTEQGHDPA